MMIVKSLKDIRGLKEGKNYFAFEITIIKKNSKVHYRIVSDSGVLGLIESEYVTILNGNLENMVYVDTESEITIQLSEIKILADKCLDINGIWVEYFERSNMEVYNKIGEIIKAEAKLQGIEIPEPTS